MARIPTLYYCGYENCNAKFKRSYKLQCHQRVHSGERPYVCDFEGCGKGYTRASHLKRHKESHEGSHSCSVEGCFQVLKTKASLQKHLDFFHHHKKHKTYKCTLCKQEFNKHSWLQRHMIRHTGKTPHVCVVEGCGREFLLPSRLKRHMQFHKGYPCEKDNCDQVFPHWSFLVKHVKECHPVVHSCDVCGKKFSSSSNMKRHRVVHTEERQVFPCEAPNCVRFYTEKKNLVHHVKYFHNKRPYSCTKEHCHRAFKTQAELDEHILYHNSKKPKRKKKKKPKPTFAAKLAGCVPPMTIAQEPVLETAEADPAKEEAEALDANKQSKHLPDYVTVTVSVHEMEDVSDSKSCLAIFEDILNNSFVPEEEEM